MNHDSEPMVIYKSRATPWILLVLLVLVGAGAAYVGYQRVSDADGRAASAKTRITDLQSRLDADDAIKGSLSAQLTQLQNQNAALTAQRDGLAKDVADKSDQLAQLQGTYDALQDKMKAEIARGDIQLSRSGGKVRVDLVDKVLFDSGEATISSRGAEVLQRVATVLASIDDKQIQVSGHTDDSPISPKLTAQFPTNWELSAARATNVVRFLAEKGGVPGKRLVASGYGPYEPIATNNTAAGRARNRRIEILLTPLLESVPKNAVAMNTKPKSGKSKTSSLRAARRK